MSGNHVPGGGGDHGAAVVDDAREIEEALSGYFNALRVTGMDPNAATSYALRCLAGAAEVVDLERACQLGEQQHTCAEARQELQDLLCKLFKSRDTLFLSLALFCSAPSDSTEPQALAGADTDASEPFYLNLQRLADLYTTVFDGPQDGQQTPVTEAIGRLLCTHLPQYLKWSSADAMANIMAALLLLPHMQDYVWQEPLLLPFVQLFKQYSAVCSAEITCLFARAPGPVLCAAVFSVQQFITYRLYGQRSLDAPIAAATGLLELLHTANQQRDAPVPHETFYNEVVNSSDFDLKADWSRCRRQMSRLFSFCRYPFMYGAAAKARLLKFEATDNMNKGMVASILHQTTPYLLLIVRRGPDLIRDALLHIRAAVQSNSLKKPLKVQFVGEPGVDEGGVSREFFQLIIQELFSPNYGMFMVAPDSNAHWLRSTQFTDMWEELELIGTIVGLAMYNGHTLGFTFAKAIYQKLLGHDLGLEFMQDVHPEIYHSLHALLRHPPERVEEDMGLSFEVEHEIDFCPQSIDLVPDGGNVAVTGGNRQAFVDAYVRYLLVDSVQPHFESFRHGFRRVCNSGVMGMFNACELEQVVCGKQEIDFLELKRVAKYEGGYTADSDVVQWFWEELLSFEDDLKRSFLQFVTSSDRAPIGGLSALEPGFHIMKNGSHSNRLPTAHTCFNVLLLPEYNSREFLSQRLRLALQNVQGFGLK